MYDIIIRNGLIIDGTNRRKFSGDVGVKRGKIAKVGELKSDRAGLIIDAKEKIVAPGFIDLLNHSDGYWTMFNFPHLESLTQQGITTMIGGGSGTSLAPLASPETIQTIRRWTNVEEITLNWLTVSELLAEIERQKLAVNFGTLVGHITLKRGLIKDAVRDFTEPEFKIAEKMLDRALYEGAFGFSTGLTYSHGKFAKVAEIIRLVKIVSKYNGIYATALRDEGAGLVSAVDEAIAVSKATAVPVEISQFKAKGKNNFPLFKEALSHIEQAANQQVNINFDLYPYAITGTVLYTYLPDWVTQGGRHAMMEKLRSPQLRSKILAEMIKSGHDFSGLTIAQSSNLAFVGKKITELGRESRVSPAEAVINTLLASNGKAICFDPALNENNVKTGLTNPLSIIATDGSGYSPSYAESKNLVHPRCFGTYPRFLGRYVREQKLLGWEEAIYKITGMPARKLGILDRGFIQENLQADLVVFDPAQIRDDATFENPYHFPDGIVSVIVNGQEVVHQGQNTGRRPGTVLRRGKN